MQGFDHQLFTPQFPRQVSTLGTRRSIALAPYHAEVLPTSTFTVKHLIAVFCACLSEKLLLLFLHKNAGLTLRVVKAIVEDHERSGGHVPKDLQINLLANLIAQFARAQNLPTASRYGYAETLIRACELDPPFKLALKKALFDRKAVECNHLMLHPFHAE